MPKVSPIQNAFTSGEVSSLLYGRTDLESNKTSMRLCKNQIPVIQGPVVRRPGTLDGGEVKDSTRLTITVSFRYSSTDSYDIEVGHLYMRFGRDMAPVVLPAQAISAVSTAAQAVLTYAGADSFSNGDDVEISGVKGMWEVNNRRFRVANVDTGAKTFELKNVDGSAVNSSTYTAYTSGGIVEKIYEIASPYSESELEQLRFTQSADVLFITHPDHTPRKLKRAGDTSWSFAVMDNVEESNEDALSDGPYMRMNTTQTTLTPSATGGSITITASAVTGINNGDGFKTTDVGRLIRIKQGSLWGYVRITAWTSTTVVTATVLNVLNNTTATKEWRLGLYSETTGYPAACTFYEDRLVFGGPKAEPSRYDMSRTGIYGSFQPTDFDLTVKDDHAISDSLRSDDVQAILWMHGDEKALMIGTMSGEWIARPSSNSEAMTPTNKASKQATYRGSANAAAIKAGDSLLFIQTSRRKLREMAYVFSADKYQTPDMTVLSEHLTKGPTFATSGLRCLAYQREPQSIVWAARRDGALLSFTYDRDQKVLAWAQHELGGYSDAAKTTPPKVESVACIPSPDGGSDIVVLMVQRYINGRIVRRKEYLGQMWETGNSVINAVYADCARSYAGSPVQNITGLYHLAGETVGILADGLEVQDKVVSDRGHITLDEPASVVHVGYRYNSDGALLHLEAGAADGTAQGKTQRSHRVIFMVSDATAYKAGPSFTKLRLRTFRKPNHSLTEPIPLYTGNDEIGWEGGYTDQNFVCWRVDGMFPFTLLAVMPHMNTQDR